jgi:hypothetical protein
MRFLLRVKNQSLLALALLAWPHGSPRLFAEDSAVSPGFVAGKYCCEMPSVGNVCVVFKADGTYAATGTLSRKDGSSHGTWKRTGAKLNITPKEETGCLVGYLTRFNIEADEEGVLTWLPRTPQNFGHSGGALVYPKFKKADGNRN